MTGSWRARLGAAQGVHVDGLGELTVLRLADVRDVLAFVTHLEDEVAILRAAPASRSTVLTGSREDPAPGGPG